MSSIKNDPRNYPPESESGKENLSDNQNSTTNSKNKNTFVYFIYFHLFR